jgi:hydroxymethylpyrimidine/phosphomethylpyrimidine kinase
VTPNLQEARILADTALNSKNDISEEIERISSEIFNKFGCRVIITGGELRGRDFVFEGDRKYFVEADFTPVQIHGTGCVYSTALTCYLASGRELEDAARLARLFVLESVKRAVRVGKCFPVINP